MLRIKDRTRMNIHGVFEGLGVGPQKDVKKPLGCLSSKTFLAWLPVRLTSDGHNVIVSDVIITSRSLQVKLDGVGPVDNRPSTD